MHKIDLIVRDKKSMTSLQAILHNILGKLFLSCCFCKIQSAVKLLAPLRKGSCINESSKSFVKSKKAKQKLNTVFSQTAIALTTSTFR